MLTVLVPVTLQECSWGSWNVENNILLNECVKTDYLKLVFTL